jgi:hypothetical protein
MSREISTFLHHMSFKLTRFYIRLSVFSYSADISVGWHLHRFTPTKMWCLRCIFQLIRRGTPWFVNLMHSTQLVIPTTSAFSTVSDKILQNTWKIYVWCRTDSHGLQAHACSVRIIDVCSCVSVLWNEQPGSRTCVPKVIKQHQGVQSWLNINLFLSGISSSAKNT